MKQLNHVLLECWISCASYPLNDSNNIQEKESKVCQGKSKMIESPVTYSGLFCHLVRLPSLNG